MKYRITATKTIQSQEINLPASKSICNRVIILNALSYNPVKIENLSDCDDTEVMLEGIHSQENLVDVKAAGTAMRFLTGYFASIAGQERIITGTERMLERPIHILVDALISLGAKIEYLGEIGYPPLHIEGAKLSGGDIYISTDVSSQFISSLAMIAPTMQYGLTMHLEGKMISFPYVKLTLNLMAQFGIRASWEGRTIRIPHGNYEAIPYRVESDWSAASYWYEIVALSGGSVTLLGLEKESLQGDANVAALFVDLGVETIYDNGKIHLKNTGKLAKKIFHDFINEPDLAQTFVVTCCMLDVPFLFTGLQSLKIKETDRILALQTELKKLGYVITDRDDSILEWNGERCEPEQEPTIKTYSDHRMAMAFAPAVLKIQALDIENPSVVSKSYPDYWNDLKAVGFEIEETK